VKAAQCAVHTFAPQRIPRMQRLCSETLPCRQLSLLE